jgi:hypothetical protein
MSATDMARRIEMSEDSRASPIHSADCSQRFSMFQAPFQRRHGRKKSPPELVGPIFFFFAPTAHRSAVGVISRFGGYGELHPLLKNIIKSGRGKVKHFMHSDKRAPRFLRRCSESSFRFLVFLIRSF